MSNEIREAAREALNQSDVLMGDTVGYQKSHVVALMATFAEALLTAQAAKHEAEVKGLQEALAELHELLMAVHSKYANETRYETALRYIREAEARMGSGNHPANQPLP